MESVIGVLGIVILFVIGLAFLIPGIVGTAVTGKIKHGPKAPRVLSIISLVFGVVLCVLPFLIACFILLVRLLGSA